MANTIAYPRTVVLEDAKLEKLIEEKSELVLEGRKISEDIEEKERNMDEIDKQIQVIEKAVDLSEFKEKAGELTKEFNALTERMEAINKATMDRLNESVPQELKTSYADRRKEKEELELARNKVALKIQKWNDKIIPLARKAMSKFLENEYEDYDTLRMENGKVVGTIFNHFEDWRKMFLSKKK